MKYTIILDTLPEVKEILTFEEMSLNTDSVIVFEGSETEFTAFI